MRRMRIIPWKYEGKQRYTLVLEWYNSDGLVSEDLKYQMDSEEFEDLKESINNV